MRCDGCGDQWSVWDSHFYCVCNREFSAQEVRDALRDLIRAASMLANIVRENQLELARIQKASKSSMREWLNRFMQGLAGGLGTAVGHLINILFPNP